jgi:hypothetical protein
VSCVTQTNEPRVAVPIGFTKTGDTTVKEDPVRDLGRSLLRPIRHWPRSEVARLLANASDTEKRPIDRNGLLFAVWPLPREEHIVRIDVKMAANLGEALDAIESTRAILPETDEPIDWRVREDPLHHFVSPPLAILEHVALLHRSSLCADPSNPLGHP